MVRALIGLEGRVARWTWELALAGARSDTTRCLKKASSRWASTPPPHWAHPVRMTRARIVCGSPDPETGRVPAASIIPDCVPLNLFGGAGSITGGAAGRNLHFLQISTTNCGNKCSSATRSWS